MFRSILLAFFNHPVECSFFNSYNYGICICICVCDSACCRGVEHLQAIVMDVGSSWTKMGLAGQEKPTCRFPTVVGRIDLRGYDRRSGQVSLSWMQLRGSDPSTARLTGVIELAHRRYGFPKRSLRDPLSRCGRKSVTGKISRTADGLENSVATSCCFSLKNVLFPIKNDP